MRSSLVAGLDTAKGLAVAWYSQVLCKEAHALTPRLCAALEKHATTAEGKTGPQPAFPFLTLLISGGHTLLLHSTGVADHRILATTDDIAIGDCLDKCARSILPQSWLETSQDVSYGKLLELFAFRNPGPNEYDATALSRSRGSKAFQSPYGWQLPIPLLATRGGEKNRSMQFSFTGLVTFAVRVAENGWVDGRLGKEPRKVPMPEEEARCLAREVMRIAFEHLASRVSLQVQKERMAHEIMPTTPISNTLVISGGVAANQYLRHVFQSQPPLAHLKIVIPAPYLCTDNAAMIAWAAHEMFPILHPQLASSWSIAPSKHWRRTPEQLEMDVLRKWSLENILHPERELNAREVLGDAANMVDTKPGLPGRGHTRLAEQELDESSVSCVEPYESLAAVEAPSSCDTHTVISSKATTTTGAGEITVTSDDFSLHSSDDVAKFLQTIQDDKSSRYPIDELMNVPTHGSSHRSCLDRISLKSEVALESQLEPSRKVDESEKPPRPASSNVLRSLVPERPSTKINYRKLWETYTFPDDGKDANDDVLRRRNSLIVSYQRMHRVDSFRNLSCLEQLDFVRALDTKTQNRWLRSLLHTTHPKISWGAPEFGMSVLRFRNVVDQYELASWVVPFEKQLAMQSRPTDLLLDSQSRHHYDEDRIVKTVWIEALVSIAPALHPIQRSDLRKQGFTEYYNLKYLQKEVTGLLKKSGWNVDGTRINAVNDMTQTNHKGRTTSTTPLLELFKRFDSASNTRSQHTEVSEETDDQRQATHGLFNLVGITPSKSRDEKPMNLRERELSTALVPYQSMTGALTVNENPYS
ncbi:hypothetical protein FKW77_003274 [Venturia effusa]|uniref:Gcp-like domain-containing protein n=1 Tax=Venturia effusa TaxID=50376 RepID=A0A517L8X2_9PEZI|nr:hypothetical protein FKW77_003274 [Venturia effusa]